PGGGADDQPADQPADPRRDTHGRPPVRRRAPRGGHPGTIDARPAVPVAPPCRTRAACRPGPGPLPAVRDIPDPGPGTSPAAGSGVGVGAVIGVPHGGHRTDGKVFESERAMDYGATELDMVVNIGKVLSGDWKYVAADISDVVYAAHARTAIVKVIFENCFLK